MLRFSFATACAISVSLALAACAPVGPRAAAVAPGTIGERVFTLSKSCWVIFQDRDGHHWFGTDGDGLFRVDGRAITHFSTRDGLADDRIRGIAQHANGEMLITTLGGVSRFDGTSFETLAPVESAEPDGGWRLEPDDLWLPLQPGQRGPNRYDGTTLHRLRFPKHELEDSFNAQYPNSSFSPYEIYCVYRDARGDVWLGTACFGLCRFDGAHLDWMYEQRLTETPEGGWFGIRSIIEDRDGAFWISNGQFRYRVMPHQDDGAPVGTLRYRREPGLPLTGGLTNDAPLYSLASVIDANGDLWFATYADGVWKYDGTTLTRYAIRDGEREVTTFTVYCDRAGKLWVGTHEAGPYRFNGTAFEPFRP